MTLISSIIWYKLCIVHTYSIFLFLSHRYLTFLIFQQGIVIVDSPGIGESAIMDDMVKTYLPEAFAFIYVINSANAGGIQYDRVS